MKLLCDLMISKPSSLIEIYRGDTLIKEATNTITEKGFHAFYGGRQGSLMSSSSGVINYLLLGTGSESISYTSSYIEVPSYAAPAAVAQRTIQYTTEAGRRYALIRLKFEVEPAPFYFEFNQMGLFEVDNNTNMMFGLELDEMLEVRQHESIVVVYSLKLEIFSQSKVLASGVYDSTPYEVYGSYHVEGVNELTSRWPIDTAGVAVRSPNPLATFYSGSTALVSGSGVYTCTQSYTDVSRTWEMFTRVVGNPPGSIYISEFKFGGWRNTPASDTTKIMFNTAKHKDVDYLFDLTTVLSITLET